MKPLPVIVIAALGLALFGCRTDSAPSHSQSHDHTFPAAQGSYVLVTLDELREVSHLVVRGSVTASTDIQKGLTDAPDYPDHLRPLHDGVQLDIKKMTFRVDEYYKGQGTEEITIMVDTTGGSYISLDVGTSYVLYLFEGGEYWDHSYLVQGLQQGVWVVDGDSATRQDGDVVTLPLPRFSEPPRSTPEG